MADTLFDAPVTPEIDPEKDYFSEQVGEGKKYKDQTAAGRALVEKDNHITRIESENAEMRSALLKSKSMQDLIDQMAAQRPTPPVIPPVTIPAKAGDPEPQTQPKVEDLVRAEVNKITAIKTSSDNRKRVAEVLRANYGPGFKTVLEQKIEALGVGPEFIDNLAGNSPQAVLQLLGISETVRPTTVAAPATRTNPGTSGQNGAKNFAFYENMRKTDKAKYFSSRNTQEMITALETQGDDFYR